MSEEMSGTKQPKSKTLGHLPIAKLADNTKWRDFVVKAEAARKANEAHEKSKDSMRELFRKNLKLSDDTEVEFTKNGDKVTITQILERKKSARESAQDLSELF